jgi:hypothetical protein
VFAMTAICTAMQQSIVLQRLSAGDPKRASMQIMMMMMIHREKQAEEGPHSVRNRRPSYLLIYVWQVPFMLLNFSMFTFLVGLVLMVWDVAISHSLSWQSRETEVSA